MSKSPDTMNEHDYLSNFNDLYKRNLALERARKNREGVLPAFTSRRFPQRSWYYRD